MVESEKTTLELEQPAAPLLPFAVGGDLLLLSSLFVLGGNFWDKVRALFLYDAEAHFSIR